MYEKKNTKGDWPDKLPPQQSPEAKIFMPSPARPTINTALARGSNYPSYAAVTAGTSSPSPSLTTSQSGKFTPATSVAVTDISSPATEVEATQSAVIAHKPSWETSLRQQNAFKGNGAVNSQILAVQMPPNSPLKSPAGLGLQFGSFTPAQQHNSTGNEKKEIALTNESYQNVHSTTISETGHGIVPPAYPQVTIGNGGSNTYPLAQQPFGGPRAPTNQPRVVHFGNALTGPSDAIRRSPVAIKPTATPEADTTEDDSRSLITNPYDPHGSPCVSVPASLIPDDSSTFSTISTHYAEKNPHLRDRPADVFEERKHPNNWKRQAKSNKPTVVETIPGAKMIVNLLNPDHFSMPMGARVICIKTDIVENIQVSVQLGVWATMDKVGNRINRLWDARQGPKDDVILLFSVNGHKAYCGLGYMQGPWEPGPVPSDWKSASDGSLPHGTMPVLWKYVKNVSYEHFRDIKHVRNGQPIVNMWNGMHFPYDEGRKVVEIYVENAHIDNVVCPRVDGAPAGNRNAAAAKSTRQTPSKMSNPPNTLNKEQAMAVTRWHPTPQAPGEVKKTPKGPPKAAAIDTAGYTTPTAFNDPASPTPRPGQTMMVKCFVDEHGNYVPIGPVAPQTPTPRALRGGPHSNALQHPLQAHSSHMRTPQQASFPKPQGSQVRPQQQALPQQVYRGRGHVVHPYSPRGGHHNHPGAGRGHPFINVGNPRMQQQVNRGGMVGSTSGPLRNARSFNNFNHPPMSGQPPAMQPSPQVPTLQPAAHFGARLPGTLRPMQSMVNISTGQWTALNLGNNDDVFRTAASKPNVFQPLSPIPGPNAADTAVAGSNTPMVGDAAPVAVGGTPEARNSNEAPKASPETYSPLTPIPTSLSQHEDPGADFQDLKELNRIAKEFTGRVSEMARKMSAARVSKWIAGQDDYVGDMLPQSEKGSSRAAGQVEEVEDLDDNDDRFSDGTFGRDVDGGVALE